MTTSLSERLHTPSKGPKVPLSGGRLGYGDLAKQAYKQMNEDHLGAFAGNLTYTTLFAIFPFLIFVLSLLFVAGQQHLLLDGLAKLHRDGAISSGTYSVVNKQIQGVAAGHQTALGFSLVISVLTALFGISGGFRSVMEATNVMYNVKETRGIVFRYGLSIVMSVVVAVLFIVALGLVVGGPAVAGQIGGAGKWAWLILQWPLLFGFVLLGLALVYYYAPNSKQRFAWVSAGSVMAGVGWLLFSLAFSFYVTHFNSYNKTYGTLAGAVVLLLYLRYSAYIFLLGAEVNQIIEAANPKGDAQRR